MNTFKIWFGIFVKTPSESLSWAHASWYVTDEDKSSNNDVMSIWNLNLSGKRPIGSQLYSDIHVSLLIPHQSKCLTPWNTSTKMQFSYEINIFYLWLILKRVVCERKKNHANFVFMDRYCAMDKQLRFGCQVVNDTNVLMPQTRILDNNLGRYLRH